MFYKKEIVKQLNLSQHTVTDVINELPSDYDWKFLCQKIELAIVKLNRASELLRIYHLEVCTLNKQDRTKTTLGSQTISEVMKAYKF
ncbi:MAG: hypothetical protein WC775_00670 [Patescibacteria group bacterium]|jgi:hypothetical protein